MQLFLRGRETRVIDADKKDTIASIKNMIYEKEKIPANFLLLTWNGRPLEDDRTLEDYGVGREDTIHYRVRGCVNAEPVLE
jgi:hypothetical protein